MKDNLARIIKRAKAKNVEVLLCGMLTPPTMGAQYQREFVTVFPDLATANKVEFMPFGLEGIALDPKLNQSDGIHPNAEGAKVMTANVYKALNPLLVK
jgi:acyl-CoA thioesterase-1